MNNRAKLSALLQEHHTSAWGWALCCCRGNREMAEDVLHNAYLKILEGKANFGGKSTFKTWLFGVIRKTAMRDASQIFNRLEKLARFWSPTSPANKTESEFYESEVRVQIVKLLEKLSQRQRQVLQLVFYHDLTIQDSARIMGVSVGSARTHYERGKDRLRKEIDKAGLDQ
jgi:RNA polymerase sigma-70 factor (ECF subfamily)